LSVFTSHPQHPRALVHPAAGGLGDLSCQGGRAGAGIEQRLFSAHDGPRVLEREPGAPRLDGQACPLNCLELLPVELRPGVTSHSLCAMALLDLLETESSQCRGLRRGAATRACTHRQRLQHDDGPASPNGHGGTD
jgi:hypothetical protein